MSTSQQLFKAAFDIDKCREPRSPEYRAGVLEALRYRLGEIPHPRRPYQIGSVQADAWPSGLDEGNAIARNQGTLGRSV